MSVWVLLLFSCLIMLLPLLQDRVIYFWTVMGFASSKFQPREAHLFTVMGLPKNCLRKESVQLNFAYKKSLTPEPHRKKWFNVSNLAFWLFLEFPITVLQGHTGSPALCVLSGGNCILSFYYVCTFKIYRCRSGWRLFSASCLKLEKKKDTGFHNSE